MTNTTRILSRSAVVLALALVVLAPPVMGDAPSWSQGAISAEGAHHLFHQAWWTVRQHFYDPKMRGLNWDEVQERYAHQLSGVRTRGDLEKLINAMLDELHTSHTELLGPDEPMYYILASVFGPRVSNFPKSIFPNGKIVYADPGFFTADTAEGSFVKAVLEGGPAAKAGLHVGDRLAAVDGKPYTGFPEWQKYAGRAVSVEVVREAGSKPLRLSLTPHFINPADAFLDATRASKAVLHRDGRTIGYVHVWSFADERIVPTFNDFLASDFKGCDGLILDLRDGIGGGNWDFFLPWAGAIPRITFINRKHEEDVSPPRPPKAMAVLINEGSRSAKEIYAYGFQKYHHGKLVGTRTAGAVIGGRAFYLDDGSLLYLAVAGVLVDGADLEGKGVSPDVPVERPLPYSAGKDPQMDAAMKTVLEML